MIKVFRRPKDPVKFSEIKIGNTFYYKRIPYLKVNDISHAMSLVTYLVLVFADDDLVQPAQCTLTLSTDITVYTDHVK